MLCLYLNVSCVSSQQKLEDKPAQVLYNQMADISLSPPVNKELQQNLCNITVQDETMGLRELKKILKLSASMQ